MRELLDTFVQLAVHAQLTDLCEQDFHNLQLLKYDRLHLLDIFDALWQKKEFKSQITIDDFSECDTQHVTHHQKWKAVNLNENSDGSVVEGCARVNNQTIDDVDDDSDEDNGYDSLYQNHRVIEESEWVDGRLARCSLNGGQSSKMFTEWWDRIARCLLDGEAG